MAAPHGLSPVRSRQRVQLIGAHHRKERTVGCDTEHLLPIDAAFLAEIDEIIEERTFYQCPQIRAYMNVGLQPLGLARHETKRMVRAGFHPTINNVEKI